MITYQVEKLVDITDELEPLLDLHWEEVARHKESIKLDVNWPAYYIMEDMGTIHTITARSDSKLIGYLILFVSPHLHYMSDVMAAEDVLFVHPDYRGKFTFVKMVKFAEEHVKALGAVNMYLHMKTEHDFSAVLERLGYVEMEKKFEKRL